jgi:hypothetical protein
MSHMAECTCCSSVAFERPNEYTSCGVCVCLCVFVRVYVLPGTGRVTAVVAITTAEVAYPSTTTVNQLLGGALFTADRKVGEGAERC